MKVGITGTRFEIPVIQKNGFRSLCDELCPEELHHGACTGGDAAAVYVTVLRDDGCLIVAHPGQSARGGDNEWLDEDAVADSHEVRATKTHFARNRDIVNETDALVALPGNMDPITAETWGGTAYTVNYARKVGKPVYVVRPDGTVERP